MKAVLGFPGDESLVFNLCTRKGLFSGTGVRRIQNQVEALGTSIPEARLVRTGEGVALAVAVKARNIMKVHCMLAHSSEVMMRKTPEAIGITTTGQWGFCEACLQAQAKRYDVPNMVEERANVKGQRFFVAVGGPMKHSSPVGNNYVVIFVDDYTRLKVVKFVIEEG